MGVARPDTWPNARVGAYPFAESDHYCMLHVSNLHIYIYGEATSYGPKCRWKAKGLQDERLFHLGALTTPHLARAMPLSVGHAH